MGIITGILICLCSLFIYYYPPYDSMPTLLPTPEPTINACTSFGSTVPFGEKISEYEPSREWCIDLSKQNLTGEMIAIYGCCRSKYAHDLAYQKMMVNR
jgi:hypothetical protein